MCMAVYLASDVALPEIAWDAQAPAFHVTGDLGPHGREVVRHFSKPFAYYVGSHTCCGCGFSYGQNEPDEMQEDAAAARKSVADLAAYLRQALSVTPELELYSCWSGDEAEAELSRVSLSPDEIGGERFWFDERRLAIVRPAQNGSNRA